MIYTGFQDKKLSMLGFGTMRLPTLAARLTKHRLQKWCSTRWTMV